MAYDRLPTLIRPVSAGRLAAFLTLFDRKPPSAHGPERRHLSGMTRAVQLRQKGDCGMQAASKLMSLQKIRRGLLALGAILVLTGAPAHAQNIDQGKSATKLFADSCTTCHRSARGLAKGRFSLTLYLFLQKHYASNSSSAWALTSYLESVDNPPRGRSRTAAAKPSPAAVGASRSSMRPPMPVPGR
jgi:mono/diheme cytochrome c family protein